MPLQYWFSGLRSRLLLLVSAALLPAVGLMVWHGVDRRNRRADEIRTESLNLARFVAQEQSRRLEGARQLLMALATSFRVDDPAQCVRDVRALVQEYRGLYSEIGWADRTGLVRCHALEGDNLSIADRQYFQQALATNGFVVSNLIVGRISRVPILAFAHPLRDRDGSVRGVLFANVDLRVLSQSLTEVARETGGTIAILDREGLVVARSEDWNEYIGASMPAREIEIMRREKELVRTFDDVHGQSQQYGIVAVGDAAGQPLLYVTYARSDPALMAAVESRFRDDLLTVALLALGMFAAAWIGAEWLVRRPVDHLVETATALGAGHLGTRARPLRSTKEFATLSQAFNHMAEQLEHRDVHLREGQRLEAIGQLAGGIAHDFNNLLTIIIGYSDALEASVPRFSGAAHDLMELRAAAEKAAGLTRQLLVFSRRQKLEPKLLQLNEVIRGMETMLRRTMGDEVQLRVSLGADLHVVRADPAQIEQVVLNLAINGRDAMPNGGTIDITTSNHTVAAHSDHALAAGEYVRIVVADTGVGIDPATRERIFEPFFTTKGARGTGLGLATVYGIVKQSGGAIRCDSVVGRGTTFEILLPKSEGTVAPAAAHAAVAVTRGKECILVVEDEPAVRSIIAATLKRRGYEVCTAEDGLSALEVLRRRQDIELVISDVRMPRMNGLAFCEQLARTHPNLRVILMSGDSAPQAVSLRGATRPAFLQKPFTPTDLLDAARQALSHANA